MSNLSNKTELALPTKPARLASLDALRGFDMFWIVGGEGIVEALDQISDTGIIRFLSEQLQHMPWAGFAFYDLIFPLFVFIVGVSLVFSLRKIKEEGTWTVLKRVVPRAVFLYLLGVFTYGGFSTPFAGIRLLGVLQRIAICYLFAALAYCFLKTWGQVVLCAGLLIGYWAILTMVPVPGIGAGNFEEGKNLTNYVDKQYLPWRKWDGDHDPEGLLSTLPAIATCLFGVFAGTLLRKNSLSDQNKVLWLALGGIVLVGLGWLWNEQFPVIKKIWTSSYVLVAAGYSCLLLAAFYQIVDIWKFEIWAQPFIWIGMNPLTIYMAHNIIDFKKLAQHFVGGELNTYFGIFGNLAVALVVMGLTFGLAYYLYRHKLFIRL